MFFVFGYLLFRPLASLLSCCLSLSTIHISIASGIVSLTATLINELFELKKMQKKIHEQRVDYCASSSNSPWRATTNDQNSGDGRLIDTIGTAAWLLRGIWLYFTGRSHYCSLSPAYFKIRDWAKCHLILQ